MGLKAEIAGIKIEADTAAELAALMREFSGNGASAEKSRQLVRRPARTPPTSERPVVMPSRSKDDAMGRLYRSLRDPQHCRCMKFLAHMGEKGAMDDQIREAVGMKGRLSGLSGSLVKRARAFGLQPEEIMVRRKVHAAGRRHYHYQLTPAMVAVIGSGGEGEKATP